MMIQVKSLTTCKRCGNNSVAWVQSKAGKWYLAPGYVDAGGKQVTYHANPMVWHTCKPLPVAPVDAQAEAERAMLERLDRTDPAQAAKVRDYLYGK